MIACCLISAFACADGPAPQILDHDALLQRENFWDNRDFEWYKKQIPFFDCPERDLVTTYYYRWELLTKHLTYGSPTTGYVFTEFIDRPFWSGTYGAISCPAGLQLYEARWLRDPTIARDYTRYWFKTPGAQPRRYSTWIADAAWAVHLVHPDSSFITNLLPDFIANYSGWERDHFVPSVGLFWQTGHDDGMEYNINSRQTKDPNRGAPGFRPTLNSYMIADALGISRIAELRGDAGTATRFKKKADTLKSKMLESLWDPKRQFFFPRSRDDEVVDGVVVKKGTLTHESGKFAGSPYGRELHGYVPWQFDIPDDRHAAMWKPLVDPQGFQAPFGPTTVERRDPMFALNKTCCWWSGQSWPYATSQTLKGLANALQRGIKLPIGKKEYYETLLTYAKTHRRGTLPYIAEACHPDTGSWEGHDSPNHSEHYFHSNFCDLVITGLVGFIPADGDDFVVHPLAPETWDWFALDNVKYRGRDLAIIWDRTGQRYKKGKGLSVFIDGVHVLRSPTLAAMKVVGPPARPSISEVGRLMNVAVNNDGHYFPQITASFRPEGQSLRKLIDGNYWYHKKPANRFTFEGTPNEKDSIAIDFGAPIRVEEVRLYFTDDVDSTAPPESVVIERSNAGYRVEMLEDPNKPRPHSEEDWTPIETTAKVGARIDGRKASSFPIRNQLARKLRFTFTHRKGTPTGLSEIEVVGSGDILSRAGSKGTAKEQFTPAEGIVQRSKLRSAGDLATNARARSSFTSRHDKVGHANDDVISFTDQPHNRWTAYESPNASDWLELDFGDEQKFSRIELAFYDDRRGVRLPKAYKIEVWTNGDWKEIADQTRSPKNPIADDFTEIRFTTVNGSKVRFTFEHALPGKTGVSEVLVWEK